MSDPQVVSEIVWELHNLNARWRMLFICLGVVVACPFILSINDPRFEMAPWLCGVGAVTGAWLARWWDRLKQIEKTATELATSRE